MRKAKHHCVIGLNVSEQHNIGRTWLETEQEAIHHGKELFVRNPSTKKLAVVKVVRILERAAPPISARKPRAEDTQ